MLRGRERNTSCLLFAVYPSDRCLCCLSVIVSSGVVVIFGSRGKRIRKAYEVIGSDLLLSLYGVANFTYGPCLFNSYHA